ncbi:hypothetical protein [Chondromyces crocatus]|uniref:NfeD-like C-terminal domain-containing protein n=1 Tax=Chondromyces crocatus TaxID=52 RepID=A0A0K1EEK2_CHOCO|nr:hypothetical protein [Chondromyces crocatus]AKT39008.1 uncharacterized protein CMC5_031540 [Chondromyces crocatus]
MSLVYVFALVVSLGLFLVQALMGGEKGDIDADHDVGEAWHGSAGSKDLGVIGAQGTLSTLKSTRFWLFFALGFGLSGSLLHYLDLADDVTTIVTSLATGLVSGAIVAFAFRAVQRTSASSSTGLSEAVGRTGRVLVSVNREKVGQVRVELKGHSVDILAITDEEELARGEAILIESLEGQKARIVRLPPELK